MDNKIEKAIELSNNLAILLSLVFKETKNIMEKLGYKLTIEDFLIFKVCISNPNLTLSEIAKLIDKDLGNFTRTVKKLENQKLLKINISAKDKRKKYTEIYNNEVKKILFKAMKENKMENLYNISYESLNEFNEIIKIILNNRRKNENIENKKR